MLWGAIKIPKLHKTPAELEALRAALAKSRGKRAAAEAITANPGCTPREVIDHLFPPNPRLPFTKDELRSALSDLIYRGKVDSSWDWGLTIKNGEESDS